MRGAGGAAASASFDDEISDAELRWVGLAPPAAGQSQKDAVENFLQPQAKRGRDDDVSALGVRSVSRPPAPDLSALLKGYKGPPIMGDAKRVPIVPYDVWAAASTLLDADRDGDIKLGRAFATELREITTQYKHEYVAVDPPVVLSDLIELPAGGGGKLNIYLEEVVPVSLILLALFFKLTYQLPGVPHENYSYERVKMAPFEGRANKSAQSFGLGRMAAELQDRGYDPEHVTRQMQIFMLRAGELASRDACDGIWLDDCLKQMVSLTPSEVSETKK